MSHKHYGVEINFSDERLHGRLVYIKGFPHWTTIHDFKKFFSHCGGIDSISIKSHFAFIQFSTPKAATEAITYNDSTFLNHRIRVEPYRKRVRRASPPRGPLQRRFNMNKLPSRSRSSSEGEITEIPNRNPPIVTIEGDQPTTSQQPPREQLSGEYMPSMGQRSQSTTWGTEPRLPDQAKPDGTIPNEVELILKLAIEKKTFRILSLPNFQDLINYLEEEKRVVQKQNGLFGNLYIGRNPFADMHNREPIFKPSSFGALGSQMRLATQEQQVTSQQHPSSSSTATLPNTSTSANVEVSEVAPSRVNRTNQGSSQQENPQPPAPDAMDVVQAIMRATRR